jgi:hypothetical protein
MSLCLAAGALVVDLGLASLTLSWTHSVEKLGWEEHWRETPAGLVLAEAAVRGSGAGMEPPPEARLVDGWWRWAPRLPPLGEVVLRRSGATEDWRLCSARGCEPLGRFMPSEADPVRLTLCPARVRRSSAGRASGSPLPAAPQPFTR